MSNFVFTFLLLLSSITYASENLIIGPIDWQSIVSLPENHVGRRVSAFVGYLNIVAKGTRCSGFLVAKDILMTNNHCINSQEQADGLRVAFNFVDRVALEDLVYYDCSEFIGTSEELDYTLLKCKGEPSSKFGHARLNMKPIDVYDKIFVIHQNCDFYLNSYCVPTKKFSPGSITNMEKGQYNHSADTVSGSSGSPIFNLDGEVVALHNKGIGNDGMGRGWYNSAVPMESIVRSMIGEFSDIDFDINGENGVVDFFNDDLSHSTLLNPGSTVVGVLGVGSLIDYYRFNLDHEQTVNFLLQFHFHQMDQVVLYFYDKNGNQLVKTSNFFSTIEFSRQLSAGTYYIRVEGQYQGGSYWLDVK